MDKIANYLQPAQTTPSIQPFPVTQSRYQPPATLEYPPLLTTPNRVGRDREIRLIKIHYETETEKMWMLIFLTRRDRDETV